MALSSSNCSPYTWRMYTHTGSLEREKIGLLRASRAKVPAIARKLGRDPTTIRRELRRSRPRYLGYLPSITEKDTDKKRRTPRRQKKLDGLQLRNLVFWKLRKRWSPEQIAHFLKEAYPLDTDMQVSHESIYTYIFPSIRFKNLF